jgi:hypothetical protein
MLVKPTRSSTSRYKNSGCRGADAAAHHLQPHSIPAAVCLCVCWLCVVVVVAISNFVDVLCCAEMKPSGVNYYANEKHQAILVFTNKDNDTIRVCLCGCMFTAKMMMMMMMMQPLSQSLLLLRLRLL